MRSALDWTADTKWAAASSLNCENKYWMGLHCASQTLSPIVICLGVHTGGSVFLGLKPLHVVAARFFFFFFPCWIALFVNHLIKLAAEYEGARIQEDSFCTCDYIPTSLLSAPRWNLHEQAVYRCVWWRRLFTERESTGSRGCGMLRGRRQTKHLGQVDFDVWKLKGKLTGGQRYISSQRPEELMVLCCPSDTGFKYHHVRIKYSENL